MRMAVYQLVAELVADIRYVERPFLAAYLGVEHHMEEDIAQFLADVPVVFLQKRVGKFIHLLYRVGTQRLVGLFPVPRTFLAQRVHHVEQTAESL